MGWTRSYQWVQKQSIQEHVVARRYWGDNATVIKHVLINDHIWLLVEKASSNNPPTRFIDCVLTSFFPEDKCYGYKDLGAASNAGFVDCPLSFIKLVEASERSATDVNVKWRGKVKAYHAHKKDILARNKSLAAGDVLSLFDKEYALTEKLKPRQGWNVVEVNTRQHFHMTAKQINVAVLVKKRE